jgi:hypothetical protein
MTPRRSARAVQYWTRFFRLPLESGTTSLAGELAYVRGKSNRRRSACAAEGPRSSHDRAGARAYSTKQALTPLPLLLSIELGEGNVRVALEVGVEVAKHLGTLPRSASPSEPMRGSGLPRSRERHGGPARS